MKKLRLNKLFHWVYAFLMFLPIIVFLLQFVVAFGTGNFDNVNFGFESVAYDYIGMSFESGISAQIWRAFDFLSSDVLGCSQFSDGWNTIFTYWVMISIFWLCFDLLMFMINLAHRWIDEGGI